MDGETSTQRPVAPPLIGLDQPPADLHTQCDSRIGTLETERTDAQDRASQAISRLESFKIRVKEVAIEQMREGRWCRDGMNEKLEYLGVEPYYPRFVVELTVDVVMELQADDEDDAASMARSDLTVTSDDDNYIDVGDISVRSVREDTES